MRSKKYNKSFTLLLNSIVMENYNKLLIPPFFLCTGELTEFFFSLKPFPRVGVFCFNVGEKIGGLKKETKFNVSQHSFDVESLYNLNLKGLPSCKLQTTL